MKRIFILSLACVCVLALNACAKGSEKVAESGEGLNLNIVEVDEETSDEDTNSGSASEEPAAEVTEEKISAEEAKGDIDILLTRLNDDVLLNDSEGSSLKNSLIAADLLEWGSSDVLSAEEVKKAVTDWMDSQKVDKTEFAAKVQVIKNSCEELLGDSGQELLETIGIDPESVSYGESFPTMVNALMEAAGAANS